MRRSAIVLVAALAACVASTSPEDAEHRLLEADRAFLQATIDDGLEGWMSFFTADAVRVDLHGDTAVGLQAIREADAPLFEPDGLRLRWEPQHAVSFHDGRQGMTRGSYTLIRPAQGGGDPEVVDHGNYLTLWRLEGGRYKVYLDTGAADPPAEKLID